MEWSPPASNIHWRVGVSRFLILGHTYRIIQNSVSEMSHAQTLHRHNINIQPMQEGGAYELLYNKGGDS
jgi:hypothetical protein